jgi:hypothetical protein
MARATLAALLVAGALASPLPVHAAESSTSVHTRYAVAQSTMGRRIMMFGVLCGWSTAAQLLNFGSCAASDPLPAPPVREQTSRVSRGPQPAQPPLAPPE